MAGLISLFKIIHCDNYGREPDREVEVMGILFGNRERMQVVADCLNKVFGGDRFYHVVPHDRKLVNDFEDM